MGWGRRGSIFRGGGGGMRSVSKIYEGGSPCTVGGLKGASGVRCPAPGAKHILRTK